MTSQFAETRVASQTWFSSLSSATCQGQSPGPAILPRLLPPCPVGDLDRAACTPHAVYTHTERMRESVTNASRKWRCLLSRRGGGGVRKICGIVKRDWREVLSLGESRLVE